MNKYIYKVNISKTNCNTWSLIETFYITSSKKITSLLKIKKISKNIYYTRTLYELDRKKF